MNLFLVSAHPVCRYGRLLQDLVVELYVQPFKSFELPEAMFLHFGSLRRGASFAIASLHRETVEKVSFGSTFFTGLNSNGLVLLVSVTFRMAGTAINILC